MLSDSTISVLHAAYDRIDASLEEFEEDVSRIDKIMRLIRKYIKHGETKPRSIVNNIVILYNVFGHAATSALDEEVEEESRVLLNTCLILLGRERGRIIDVDFLRYLESSLRNPED